MVLLFCPWVLGGSFIVLSRGEVLKFNGFIIAAYYGINFKSRNMDAQL